MQLRETLVTGANFDSGFSNCFGCATVLYAFSKKRSEIANYLLSHGASIPGATCKSTAFQGYMAFHFAASFDDMQTLHLY